MPSTASDGARWSPTRHRQRAIGRIGVFEDNWFGFAAATTFRLGLRPRVPVNCLTATIYLSAVLFEEVASLSLRCKDFFEDDFLVADANLDGIVNVLDISFFTAEAAPQSSVKNRSSPLHLMFIARLP